MNDQATTRAARSRKWYVNSLNCLFNAVEARTDRLVCQ